MYIMFSNMMWRQTTQVAFGIRGRHVIAWYCNKGAPAPEEKPSSYNLFKENVGRLCIVDGYNDCYNQKALAAHNDAREKHQGYVKLELDTEIAKFIQAQLDHPDFTGTIGKRGKYENCGQSVFTLTDMTKLSDVLLTNMASDFWYKGIKYYDFETGDATKNA
jgi:hypothetical protein